MSPFRTRRSSEMLCIVCEKCKILCYSIYKKSLISTLPTGESLIKSNSLINAPFIKKYWSESIIKGNLKLEDPADSRINANDLLCYSWKVISQYLSDKRSQSTWYSLSGEYWYRIHNEYPISLVKTQPRHGSARLMSPQLSHPCHVPIKSVKHCLA